MCKVFFPLEPRSFFLGFFREEITTRASAAIAEGSRGGLLAYFLFLSAVCGLIAGKRLMTWNCGNRNVVFIIRRIARKNTGIGEVVNCSSRYLNIARHQKHVLCLNLPKLRGRVEVSFCIT